MTQTTELYVDIEDLFQMDASLNETFEFLSLQRELQPAAAPSSPQPTRRPMVVPAAPARRPPKQRASPKEQTDTNSSAESLPVLRRIKRSRSLVELVYEDEAMEKLTKCFSHCRASPETVPSLDVRQWKRRTTTTPTSVDQDDGE